MRRAALVLLMCLASSAQAALWGYVDAAGSLWGCSSFIGDERFRYGSIVEHPLAEIWEGAARRRCLDHVAAELDPADCRENCRMDEINRYLEELVHPSPHVNFI